jgi:hypothetical protein
VQEEHRARIEAITMFDPGKAVPVTSNSRFL